MTYSKSIPHLGMPANINDKIISRRIRLIEKFPGFIGNNLSLLDIGCGNGATIFKLSNQMEYCTGIEINNKHKEEFDLYKSKNNITNCIYKILDVVANSAEEKYDRIISFEVIEHLASESGLKFYYDSLRNDGLIAISVPNKWWIFETHGAKLPLLPWNRVPFFSWLPEIIHKKFANARIYTKNNISKLLLSYGFEILESKYIMAPMDVLKKGMLKNLLIKYVFNSSTTKIPFKATSIMIIAKKKAPE